jgi:hypothetical protein
MKPKLTVLLAAGSTINLGIGPSSPGMPSTKELTAIIAGLKYPAAVRPGMPFVLTADQTHPSAFAQSIPILPRLTRALHDAFSYVDFETILHAIEELIPLLSGRNILHRTAEFYPVLSAFVDIRRQFDFLSDRTVLNVVRQTIIKAIYDTILNRLIPDRFLDGRSLALHRLVQTLETVFTISVFTLNYDDVVDGARSSWFDGFTKPQPGSLDGRVWTVNAFDAHSFINWRNAADPLLAHLHGSVRFGYLHTTFGLGKYSDTRVARDSLEILVSDRYSSGQIVSAAPIISGLSKVAKLTYNPEPFGYYYRAFIDCMLENERLLVIGYGARDEHFNTWLTQFTEIHGNNRKIGWICLLPGTLVGQRTPEKEMISALAGPGHFRDFKHYHEPSRSQTFHACGSVGLIPSGFPIQSDAERQLTDFLQP